MANFATAIDIEEIDFARPARLIRGPRQPLLSDQGIDQRRFADIRATSKGHFGGGIGRQLLDLGHPQHKGRLTRKQYPRRL